MAKHVSSKKQEIKFKIKFSDSWVIVLAVILLCIIGKFVAAGIVLVMHQIFMLIYRYIFRDKVSLPDFGNKFLNKVLHYQTPVFIGLAVLVGVFVPIFTKNWKDCAEAASVILLLSCNNKLNEILGLILYNTMINTQKIGFTVKNYDVIKKLGHVKSVIMNKTGTVTDKYFKVIGIYPKTITENQFISILSKIESKSKHPIAMAIGADQISSEDVCVNEFKGNGVQGKYNEFNVIAGNAKFLSEHGVDCDIPEIYGIAVHLAINDKYCGYIVFENRTRVGTYDDIERLRDAGIENLYMLSYDLQSVVQPVACALGFNVYKAELNKNQKIGATKYIVENKQEKSEVAYIGNLDDELDISSYSDISICLGCEANCDVFTNDEGLTTLPELFTLTSKSSKKCEIVIYLYFVSKLLVAFLLAVGLKCAILAVILIYLAEIASLVLNYERL